MNDLQTKYTPRDNRFYERYYAWFLQGLLFTGFLMLAVLGMVWYQVAHRPLPDFNAVAANHETMMLTPFEEPNLLSDTLIRWASKAATKAYTFDFVNYEEEIAGARSYFTDAGWQDFRAAISSVLSTIVQNQLFITGVVVGTPVIANQGPLGDIDRVWRVQIPFLVTYQSANTTRSDRVMVQITIVSVPTSVNPQGIGIDQFVMRG